jgi:hypothetical protein
MPFVDDRRLSEATPVRPGGNAVAHLQRLDPGSGLLDDPRHLVADRRRQLVRCLAGPEVDLRGAQAALLDPHPRLAGTERGQRAVDQLDAERLLQHRCLHRTSLVPTSDTNQSTGIHVGLDRPRRRHLRLAPTVANRGRSRTISAKPH